MGYGYSALGTRYGDAWGYGEPMEAATPAARLLAALAGTKSVLFDVADLTSLRKASDGIATVTADADTVGLAFNKREIGPESMAAWFAAAPELIVDPGFDAPAQWSLATGFSITGGKLIAASPAAFAAAALGLFGQAFPSLPGGTLTNGGFYLLSMTISAYTSGSIRGAIAGGVTTSGPQFNAAGISQAVLQAQAANTGFNCQVHSASGILEVSDVSLKAIPGIPAIQATAGARPLLDITSGVSAWEFDGTDDFLGFAFQGGAGPASATVLLAVRSADAAFTLLSDRGAGAHRLCVVADAGAGTGLGDADVMVDGEVFETGVATLDQLHAALCDNAWHIVEIDGVDLSAWTGMDIARYSNTPSGSYAQARVCNPVVIDNTGMIAAGRDPARARSSARQWLREKVGLA